METVASADVIWIVMRLRYVSIQIQSPKKHKLRYIEDGTTNHRTSHESEMSSINSSTLVCTICALSGIGVSIQDLQPTAHAMDAFTIPATMHGTQFYLTIEERDKVYKADLSNNPEIEMHRASIIFQPMVAELAVYSLLRRTMLLVTYCSIFHTRLCASSRRP